MPETQDRVYTSRNGKNMAGAALSGLTRMINEWDISTDTRFAGDLQSQQKAEYPSGHSAFLPA